MKKYIKIGSVFVFLVLTNTNNAAERLARTPSQAFGGVQQKTQTRQEQFEQENTLLRQQLAEINARIAKNETAIANVAAHSKMVEHQLDRHEARNGH